MSITASCRSRICRVSEPVSGLRPSEDTQVREAVAWALAEERKLEIVGAGSKRALGRPGNADLTLDLSALAGVRDYAPAELYLAARPATPLGDVEALLQENRQTLAFEPPDLGPLLGGPEGAGTLGGVIACNLAGPRRFKAGAARDHFLGFEAVNGRAEAFKSGGKVVKNVTGYDLSKLMAGAYGTLAVLTDITVKVLPMPEKTRTVLVFGLDDGEAVATLAEAARSTLEPSGLAHLPAFAAKQSNVDMVSGPGLAVTAIRVEGPAPSAIARAAAAQDLFAARGAVEELHGKRSARFWREVAGVHPFVADQGRPVWRLSVPPAAGARVTAAIGRELADVQCLYDWAGGLIWLAVGAGEDAGQAVIRRVVDGFGGHATLIRANADLRAAVPVFHPQSAPVAGITRRIKAGFDPRGLFNPGRMYPGV